MTQEDRQLLLEDLCARSPYGVKLKIGDYSDYKLIGIVISDESPIKIEVVEKNEVYKIEVIPDLVEPCLRPMSSMTEEEKKELLCTIVGNDAVKYFQVLSDGSIDNTDAAHQDLQNFVLKPLLNKKHIQHLL